MKITQFETLESSPYSNVPWVQVHTDDGLVGLGGTFFVLRAGEGGNLHPPGGRPAYQLGAARRRSSLD